ncbi:hypothetical protein [Neobacillus mesonae]|uniref:hypothetical protein n=1 Tax=Neobacillus mesonae TaxID=1193713 RepID=UPI0020423564|nr:hypothetical protein [Neobacillus mesonae]MCM3569351.1 hypothetical protein [Neobacillus mesonae]
MANIPAKIIEQKLKKEGIEVDGYNVIYGIEADYQAEAEELGMSNGITDEFDFKSEYLVAGGKVTFYGRMCRDFRQVSPTQELPYYYPFIESCKIEKDGEEEKVIALEVYWS